ncbi:MAG: hypothetical protein E6I13_14105 [Chloroflexi bacterium]|nr:MAG: hypothetical protein E6I13_14105 [Chloroflexota bacterium]
MAYLLAGPLVAVIGIVAVFFVLRRKSVDKRSMYSARRSQIEHKVRAARQRTMAPHGHAEKPAEPAPAAESQFAPTQVQQAATYQAPAYEPPPARPAPPPSMKPPEAPVAPPWEQPSIPAPAPSSFDFPPAAAPEPYTPAPAEPFRPAPEPTPMPSPSEPAWTPAPRPAEPGAWSVVSTSKDSAAAEPESKKKDRSAPASSWQLASGDSPVLDAEEPTAKRSSGTLMAVAQYAILVVGLVMVLIGVLVMVANSHVT